MTSTVDALRELREALAAVDLSLPLDSAPRAERVRTELAGQIDDYLLARLARLDAPLLVVLAGSTGAGKSTITNSLVGANVSLAGVLRPSTRSPVLVCHPDDRSWFLDGGVLPDLPRSTGQRPEGGSVHVVESDRVPPGVGLLDAPDIDSVETANHELAAQLLGAGDAWLFVTTASRYADAVPWEYLRRARERAVAMAIVINRIPPGVSDEVADHLGDMLRDNELGDVPVLTVDEISADDDTDRFVDGRLDDAEVAAVRDWFTGLVADDASRQRVVLGTLDGAIRSIPDRVDVVEDAIDEQRVAVHELLRISHDRYGDALAALDDELGNGVLLRGEVLDRWREHVGTSAFMERLQTGIGRIRARIWSVLSGRPIPNEAAKDQLESNLTTLVRNHADRAALATVTAWDATASGSAVLAGAERGLDRPTLDIAERLDRELDDWHDAVLALVEERAGNKLAVARTLSLGLNGVGVAVMIGVFAQTGGVTGAEAGVAAGTAAVSQTLLTALFGENAVRDLVRIARDDLRLRLVGVFETERSRFEALLRDRTGDDDADDLRRSSETLQSAWTRRDDR